MVVNTLRIVVLTAFVIVRSPWACAGRGVDLPLFYDPGSGEVVIDVTGISGGILSGYGFEVPFDGYRPESWTPVLNTSFVDISERKVSETNLSGIPAGVYSLGAMLPAGLSLEMFNAYFVDSWPAFGLTGNSYYAIGEPGSGTVHIFSPNYFPSPFPAVNLEVDPRADTVWSSEMDLLYDPITGDVSIDSSGLNGGSFVSYNLEFNEEVVEPTAFRPVSDSLVFGATANSVTETSFSPIDGGRYSIGAILRPGLDFGELNELIAEASFLGEPSHGPSPFDVSLYGSPMQIRVVPEPAMKWTFLILFLLAMRRCGRRRTAK